jgi:CHRD domain-containing protein
MRNGTKRVGSLASLSAALAVVVTGVALAASTAAATPVHAVAYRLTATLTPAQVVPAVQAPSGAVGHFRGVLIRSGIGAAKVASLAGCKVVQGPRRSGLVTKLNCAGANVTLPGAPGQWRLFWRLSVSNLSGAATAAAIHMAPVGHSAAAAFAMCAPCQTITHGQLSVTAGQADTLIKGGAYADVSTAAHPDGEIRGQINRASIGFRVGR